MLAFHINTKSPIITRFLHLTQSQIKDIGYTQKKIADLHAVTGFHGEDLYSIHTGNPNMYIYMNRKYLLVLKIRNLPSGKTIAYSYIESLSNTTPTIIDALTGLAMLQIYVVKKFNLPTFTIVNLYRNEGGLQTTADFRVVRALSKEPHFVFEVICTDEKQLIFSTEKKAEKPASFPLSVLSFFSKIKFPGKFAITSTFEQAISLIESKCENM